MEKYNEIQLTKNKMDLKNQRKTIYKLELGPTFPGSLLPERVDELPS